MSHGLATLTHPALRRAVAAARRVHFAAVCLIAAACGQTAAPDANNPTDTTTAAPTGAASVPTSASAGSLGAAGATTAGVAGNGEAGSAGSARAAPSAGSASVTTSAGSSAPPILGSPDAGPPAAGSGGADAANGGAIGCDRPASPGQSVPTLYVIGDSTASVYAKDLYPRTGWAQVLTSYFAPGCAVVSDKALSGRSSKSFYDEGSWTPVRNALRAGDYVFIQFGHNDEKSDDAARYTQPATTYTQYLTKYIDETQAEGATPLLLTPIQRNEWSAGKIVDTHGDYPAAVQRLADQRKLGLIDMTALTDSYFERIGEAMTTALFMNLAPGESPNYPSGNQDDTHLKEQGAKLVCQLAVADLYRQDLAPAQLLKMAPELP
jgi:lysophospholipase L1-like esterase